MTDFDTLYLSWRSGQSTRRFIVGIIKKDEQGNFTFRYDMEEVTKATKVGFQPYTEFADTHKIYTSNVLEIFAQRLTRSARPDIQNFYDFWEIDPMYVNDKFYLLGHTQGLLPTDNFEFLADYKPVEGLHFLTDLAGLSHLKLAINVLQKGDRLTVKHEPDNEWDNEAVYLEKTGTKIGYIKKIHCRVFKGDDGGKLKTEVKAIDKNGTINRVFVKVCAEK